LKRPSKSRAVFLDRDGVINEILFHQDMGVLETPFTPEQFRLKPEAAGAIRKTCPREPRIGVVLGSGLGEFADAVADAAVIPYADIPHFKVAGVAGHAGLFGTALDVATFGQTVLDDLGGAGRVATSELWQAAVRRDPTTPGSTRALGFDAPSPGAVGHLGFTGTSVWWDMEKDCHIVLLSNRIHPSRNNDKIKAFRPYVHDLIMKTLFHE